MLWIWYAAKPYKYSGVVYDLNYPEYAVWWLHKPRNPAKSVTEKSQ